MLDLDREKYVMYKISNRFIIVFFGLLMIRLLQAEVFTVVNTNDDGEGSLRWAIEQANQSEGTNSVQFNIPDDDAGFDGSVWIIRPQTNLPTLYGGSMWIDGGSQEDNQGDRNPDGPDIIIDGSDMPQGGIGFLITSADNVLSRLVISGFLDYGIRIRNPEARNNRIWGNYIGTDATGSNILGNAEGIYLSLSSTNTIIGGAEEYQRNVISGNYSNGIHISESDSNTIIGNFIGTDRSGGQSVPNGRDGKHSGILLSSGSDFNIIGGNDPGHRNIIAGNGRDGIQISMADCNTIIGNFIGTDVTGSIAMGNGKMGAGDGIDIRYGSTGNKIGGKRGGERNIISDHTNMGVRIFGEGTRDNTIQGNFIGTDITGSMDFGNGNYGVYIYYGATENTIGGYIVEEGNLISGNDYYGVMIEHPGTESNKIIGNIIGADATGLIELGNQEHGVCLTDSAQFNQIGPDNLISGNGGYGVLVYGSGTNSNFVKGNGVGIDSNGNGVIPNQYDGICVAGGASSNGIGGPMLKNRNIVSGNGWTGIRITGDNSYGNIIYNNYCGTDTSGTQDLGNAFHGIHLSGHSHLVYNNLVSGNDKCGIVVSVSSHSNVFEGNKIGVKSDGLRSLPNSASGIRFDGQTDAEGDTIGPNNQIWYNGEYGIELKDSTIKNVTITQNSIAGNANGAISLQNGANENIAPPTISGITPLTGTALPESVIEIYSDSLSQGKSYEGSTTADDNGNWTYITPVQGPYVTATATDSEGNTSEFSAYCDVSSVKSNRQIAQMNFQLFQNYPNPFNPETRIRFYVQEPCRVQLSVYDLRGREIDRLIDGMHNAGQFEVLFNGSNLPSGMYIYRIQMGRFEQIRKMVLVE